jgi:spermidine synthase
LISLVASLFFLSGAAGLVYQVLWMRELGLFFGSDLHGVAIVLSAFMGGIAVGSLLGGRLAERVDRPLVTYGLAEVGIGASALLLPGLLELLDPILRLSYPSVAAGRGWVHQTVRAGLAGGALLVPTALMGATLPLILKHFVRARASLGRTAALFYAANTLGACAGTLAGGFLLLPQLGMAASTLCAALVNLSIGIVCIGVGAAVRPPRRRRGDAEVRAGPDPLPDAAPPTRRRASRAALCAAGASGFGSFAFEVVWTRVLVQSFSGTVYAFASMLACFLFGIFVGSLLITRRVDRGGDPLWLFARLELWVAVSVGALCLATNSVPGFFARLFEGIARFSGADPSRALAVATLVASFDLLVVPTTLLGATFPVALRAYATDAARIGERSGRLLFANTLGAILGSLIGGLVLIPTLGAKGSLASLALLFGSIGLGLAAAGGRPIAGRLRAALVPLVATLSAAGLGLRMPDRVAFNFGQGAGDQAVLYHAEGVQNAIDVVRSPSGVTSLVIGGNVEADDGPTQRRHFVLKGHLPLLFVEEPRSVLVIGLGMGITLQATARHPGLERIDVVELSPEIVEAQALLREINGGVVTNPLVRVTIDDGRHHLRMTDRAWDMITADPIHPKISRVGYLYTREYYQSIRDHLNPGGVVCQWMPLYQIAPERLRSAMKTFVEVFPGATFWYVKNHGLLVARRDDGLLDPEVAARRLRDPRVRADLASIDLGSLEQLLGLLLLGPDEIRRFAGSRPGIPLNTDDRPYLEYFVPADLFYRPADNLRALLAYEAAPWNLVRNPPADSVERLRQRVDGRAERLLRELAPGEPASTAEPRPGSRAGGPPRPGRSPRT